MALVRSESKGKKSRGQFSEFLWVEGKLALREPYGVGFGIGFPVVLLMLFGYISQFSGSVGTSALTLLDLYIPTIIVIGFISIALLGLPQAIVRDREIGWLRRISTTPVPPSRLLASQMILNLIVAFAASLIVLSGGEEVFGAQINVGIPFFVLSVILSVAEIFSLGLVIAALAPSQNAARALSGFLFYLLLFLSGLWVQPTQVGGTLATVMYYSPAGAAAQALLYSVFNTAPPFTALVTMVGYTATFSSIATRYFRWE